MTKADCCYLLVSYTKDGFYSADGTSFSIGNYLNF